MSDAVKVKESLRDFENKLLSLFEEIKECKEICVPPSPFFSEPENSDMSKEGHIHRAIKAYSDIWYVKDEDGRSTRTYQGVILGEDDLLQSVREVNTSKDILHEVIASYTKDLSPSEKKKVKGELSEQLFGRKRLSGLRLQRLNLNACYRQIPYFMEPAKKISYSLLRKGRSIKKMTVAEVRSMLQDLGGNPPYPDRIQIQLNLLNQFSDSMYMARIQENSPIIKANIRFERRDELGNLRYVSKKPPLPFIIPGHQLPNLKFYSEEEASKKDESQLRKLREDKRIEDYPIIKSLRVHRYL